MTANDKFVSFESAFGILVKNILLQERRLIISKIKVINYLIKKSVESTLAPL